MQTVVIGAGPAGLFTAIALARRGRRVFVVDRDPGPSDHQTWARKGVMQFHHAHTFRWPAVAALKDEMPDVVHDLVTAGAVIAHSPDGQPFALLCRRMMFERVLRATAVAQHNLSLLTGHVEAVLHDRGRVFGVRVDGATLPADVVIDASGRSSRVTEALRGPAEGGDCGATYVTRQFRVRADATNGPVNNPGGLGLTLQGYSAVVFLHDNQTFSVTFIHAGADRSLRGLRYPAVFDRVSSAIPVLSDWVSATRAEPITPVLPGGRLYNSYRRQLDETGRPRLAGLITVGDAVCTTTPLAGRGVSLAFRQARELIRILDECGYDPVTAAISFDQWCGEHIRPWFDDHRHSDADRIRRWSGGDIDLSRPLPSDLIVAAVDADPRIRHIVGPYAAMDSLPTSLAPAEPYARAVFQRGWRPTIPAGPTLEELAELCTESTHYAAATAG